MTSERQALLALTHLCDTLIKRHLADLPITDTMWMALDKASKAAFSSIHLEERTS